jgi:D-alanine--poly(phosphoribitol) ligase subunit 1
MSKKVHYYYNLGMCFEDIAYKYGETIAIKYYDCHYSYSQLNQKANQMVQLLQEGYALQRGDVVAIVNTKKFESYAIMLACLKTGIIYTNIDIDNPVARIITILNTCKPKIVFCDTSIPENIAKACNQLGIKLFSCIDESFINILNSYSGNNSNYTKQITGSTIAYIMFTSGSTGIPKGAAITHQNLISFINWSISRFNICESDIFANVSPMYFDNSVFDFYTSLFSGACLSPIKKELLTNPLDLIKAVDDLKCTIWFSVPSLLIYLMTMKALSSENFKHIRIISFGGEGYPKVELKKLYDLYKNRVEFINVYGPTETTCICSSHTISEDDFRDLNGLPPIGTINQNFDYLILNDEAQITDRGELCLMGPNVGLGYYNDDERTKSAFFEYSGHGYYKQPMYKTGDIVRKHNGNIWFICRKDNQIKHMGYRIELEEIELALNSIEHITQSAVIYDRVNPLFGKIIAFVSSYKKIDSNVIKKELKLIIPEYMVPNTVIVLEILPKNANGKIDKSKLKEIYKSLVVH